MRLTSVSFANHKVLGDTTIGLLPTNEDETVCDISNTTIRLGIDKSPAPNQYTFIIGENGSGKTFFFRTIIYAMNLGAETPLRHREFEIMDDHRSEYGESNITDDSITALQKLNVFKGKYVEYVNHGGIDFLKQNDAQLILVTSTFERKLIHRNARYRSFNHQSAVNHTHNLLLRALFKYKGDTKIQRLNNLLNLSPQASWKIRYSLPIKYIGHDPNGPSRVLLETVKDATIPDFLRILSTLKLNNEGILSTPVLEKEPGDDNRRDRTREYTVLQNIYKSGSFFKLYFDENGPKEGFFKKLADCKLLRQIKAFLSAMEINELATQTGNFNASEEQLKAWEIDLELDNILQFDLNILALLVDHNVVELEILADDIPVDDLSSGQKNLIRVFSLFADMPLPINPENLIFLYDEPENSLHPKWQQEFPGSFRLIVDEVYHITNSHFIFATHSPVLLMKAAGLPDTNVLKFERNNGNLLANPIAHISSYSIEEVLLDEFKITYREQSAEHDLTLFLDEKAKLVFRDPLKSVADSFNLRHEINHLYQSIKSTK